MTEAWTRSALDAGKPYSTWKSPGGNWFAVLDRNGVNVLRAVGKTWKFTDEETAARLAREWNG